MSQGAVLTMGRRDRLVKLEMHWTVNWFQDREHSWLERLECLEDEEREDGLKCYCHKQIGLWKALGDAAAQRFSDIIGQI